jgi:hypothetical protein
VEDGTLSALAGLKPGDHGKAIYVEMGDQGYHQEHRQGVVQPEGASTGLLRSLSGVISTEAH